MRAHLVVDGKVVVYGFLININFVKPHLSLGLHNRKLNIYKGLMRQEDIRL
jgi:hypothetical protein